MYSNFKSNGKVAFYGLGFFVGFEVLQIFEMFAV